jgi:hypothetical protein
MINKLDRLKALMEKLNGPICEIWITNQPEGAIAFHTTLCIAAGVDNMDADLPYTLEAYHFLVAVRENVKRQIDEIEKL